MEEVTRIECFRSALLRPQRKDLHRAERHYRFCPAEQDDAIAEVSARAAGCVSRARDPPLRTSSATYRAMSPRLIWLMADYDLGHCGLRRCGENTRRSPPPLRLTMIPHNTVRCICLLLVMISEFFSVTVASHVYYLIDRPLITHDLVVKVILPTILGCLMVAAILSRIVVGLSMKMRGIENEHYAVGWDVTIVGNTGRVSRRWTSLYDQRTIRYALAAYVLVGIICNFYYHTDKWTEPGLTGNAYIDSAIPFIFMLLIWPSRIVQSVAFGHLF
jgi:hypothetical protein